MGEAKAAKHHKITRTNINSPFLVDHLMSKPFLHFQEILTLGCESLDKLEKECPNSTKTTLCKISVFFFLKIMHVHPQFVVSFRREQEFHRESVHPMKRTKVLITLPAISSTLQWTPRLKLSTACFSWLRNTTSRQLSN